jgi:exodeoxyribonuclease VII small subunit
MSGKKATTQNPPKSFEEALAELEQILARIESGEVGLEESLLKYERGNFLIKHCRDVLNQAEKRIESMSKDAADESSTASSADEDSEEEV